jgi:hypothetical protein
VWGARAKGRSKGGERAQETRGLLLYPLAPTRPPPLTYRSRRRGLDAAAADWTPPPDAV